MDRVKTTLGPDARLGLEYSAWADAAEDAAAGTRGEGAGDEGGVVSFTASERKTVVVEVACSRCEDATVKVEVREGDKGQGYCKPCEVVISKSVYGPFCLHKRRVAGKMCPNCLHQPSEEER